ncbi:MAG: type II secretion system protein [Phycisphaerales bacterium JB060]
MVVRPHNARGFLLIDVIVGTVLIGVALGGILVVSTRALAMQRDAADLRQAGMVADEVMSTVYAYGTEEYTQVLRARGRASEPFERFEYQVDIDNGRAGEADEVHVLVTWQSATGQPRSFELDALIAPRLGDEPDPNRQPPEAIDR